MRLARFRTVRGRLLAIMAVIAVPIALAAAATAFLTYRSVVASIETAQLRAADDFAVRTRVWYRGALRTLLASAESVTAHTRPGRDECAALGDTILAGLDGYRVLHVERADGVRCTAVAAPAPAISPAAMDAILARLADRPPVVPWAGTGAAGARYDHVKLGEERYLAVYARPEQGASFRQAVMLIAPQLLETVFEFGAERDAVRAVLIGQGSVPVTAPGASDLSWLPRAEIVPETLQRWTARSRAGETRAYAARKVAQPDLYVVASFDDTAERAAQVQFWLLLLLPAAMLAALALIYARAIDRHCIRWLRTIETVSRARPAQTGARIAMAVDMPDDIRSVATAFNEMVEAQERRQSKLQGALDDNRYLVRELHHRVKNSLQVVQSYLGLAKRNYRGEARIALADAECRVHVLSAAYRFTLADGEMQPVRVDLFLDDVVTMIANLLRQGDQSVAGRFETSATLAVDRIIPLGFLIVDVAARALHATPGLALTVTVDDLDDGRIEVVVHADRQVRLGDPPKMVAGLLAQVEAQPARLADGRELGSWRIAHIR